MIGSGRLGLRLALALLALAATPLLPALADGVSSSSAADPIAPAESTVPEDLQGMVGDWILAQEDDSLPTCPLTLTDQEAIGGWAVTVPEACPAPYPGADQLTAWNVDESDGSVILLNEERKVVLRLSEDEDGLYDTDPNEQPHFYLSPISQSGDGGEADGGD